MKKEERLVLTFLGEGGEVLLCRALTSAPLREEAVLRLSVEFFGDPEPCMIHRSAVMSRMYMEMLEFFLAALRDGTFEFQCSDLPERLGSFVDVADCAAIRVSGC